MADGILELILRIKKQGDGAKETEKELTGVSDAADALKTPLAGAAAGLAILAAGYQAVIAPTLEYADQVRTLGRNIGASAEEASKLIQAADDTGVSVDSLSTALKAAIKNGTEPTIENLSKLSDQYLAIQDPIERSEFLMAKFGKSGLELAPLMERGAEGIRDLGDAAEQTGLVMSEQSVQAARDLEIALDNLGDIGFASVIAAGNMAIPTLTAAANAMLTLLTFTQQINAALAEHNTDVVQTATSYEAYVAEMERAAEAAGKHILTQQQANDLLTDSNDRMKNYVNGALIIATEAEFNLARQIDDRASAIADARANTDELKTSTENLTAAESGLSPVWREAKSALDQFNIGQAQKMELQQAMALASGEITQADVDRQEQVGFLTKQLELGNLTQDEYIARLQAMADGTDTLGLSLGKETEAFKATGDEIEDKFLATAKKVDTSFRVQMPSAINTTNDKLDDSREKFGFLYNDLIGIKAAADSAAASVRGLGGALGGLPNAAGGFGGGEKRASGGPVEAGKMYTVGEQGPETFVAPADGFIIPNGGKPSVSGGLVGGGAVGGSSVSLTIPVVLDGREVTRIVVDNIDEALVEKGRYIPQIA